MTPSSPRDIRALAASAAACAALVLVVVASSAWLRLAAAPCPPGGCEGFALADGVRLAHRIAAMGVSVLALVIAALAWKFPARPGRRLAAVAVIVLVGVLALVGRRSAGTVPPAVVFTNLLGGLALLALCAGLAASAGAARGRPSWTCVAAALLHGACVVTGAALAAWPAGEPGGLGVAHRALSWATLAAWGLAAFSGAFPREARTPARIAAALVAVQGALALAATGEPGARWLHNLLTAATVCAVAAAAARGRAPPSPAAGVGAGVTARP